MKTKLFDLNIKKWDFSQILTTITLIVLLVIWPTLTFSLGDRITSKGITPIGVLCILSILVSYSYNIGVFYNLKWKDIGILIGVPFLIFTLDMIITIFVSKAFSMSLVFKDIIKWYILYLFYAGSLILTYKRIEFKMMD